MKSQQELFDLFLRELKKERKKIDNASPKGLYKPVSYTLDMGGKRLRPVLVLTGANLFSENIEEALPAAIAIEVFHNFTLLHDDLMDNASVRRGKPTVHLKFNPNTAILSGDA
ncbi:polyprenyl synthetase family protein [Prolixibacter bellariivorans]|nr:polyprenyl synthetase family protein [Prolixibacter bellariivorans]